MCVCVCVGCVCRVCVGCVCSGGSHLNLKILRMVHWCLVLLTPPPSLFNKGVQGQCPTPFPPPSYNIPVEHIQCIMYWTGVLNWTGICTGLVYWTAMASQYIQHTSPVPCP